MKLPSTSSPPTWRVKCSVLKIGKCTWLGCHVVESPELQVDWINVGVVYIWNNTHVTNNHVREFKSMPIPSRGLHSNQITLVWVVVLVCNPITLSLYYGLGSSQVVKHDDTPGSVHLLERLLLLGRRQRWAKHLLVFLLCLKETKKDFLAS